jgi:hypothetical protein
MSATTTHGFPHGSHAIPIAVMNLGVARIGLIATEAVTLDFRARRDGDGPVHHAPVDAGGH